MRIVIVVELPDKPRTDEDMAELHEEIDRVRAEAAERGGSIRLVTDQRRIDMVLRAARGRA
jgi:hypothetical protein